LRLLNRIADESYRQFVSWTYLRRGWIVIYDRHFQFDFQYVPNGSEKKLSNRLHRWWLTNIYPRPDLVIYLDAPAEVLFSRKHEGTIESLDARRQAFIAQGQRTPNFVRIDAAQPLESAYEQVADEIRRFSVAHPTVRKAANSESL
jgi:thymidylate kinase